MKVQAFAMAVILGLLLPVMLGFQPAMAALDSPDELLITDPSGDVHGYLEIDIVKVYVTHDSENLYVDVQGPAQHWPLPYVPYISNYTEGGSSENFWYSECYIHLNDLTVTVWDNDPRGYLINLQSTDGSVQAPCTVTIPLELLEFPEKVDIYVETKLEYTNPPFPIYSSDRAPDSGSATYTLNEQPIVNSVTADPAQLWPPNNIL